MRRSKRPEKQLLWMLMDKIYPESQSYEVGLDVACGSMLMRKYFKTKEYIGVDFDENEIKLGLTNYPDVKGYVMSIEEMDGKIKGDFVTCLQTIGINNKFNTEATMQCVNNIIQSTITDGMLVFNVGGLASSYFDQIDDILINNFKNVSIYKYGAFHKEVSGIISLFLAYIMYLFPKVARTSKNYQSRLYVAKGKL